MVPRIIVLVALGVAFLTTAATAKVGQVLNENQLNLPFTGSKVEATDTCLAGINVGDGTWDFDLSSEGTFTVNYQCDTGRRTVSATDKGRWWVDQNTICMTPEGSIFEQYLSVEDECWRIKESRFFFRAHDMQNVAFWNITVSHPQYAEKKALLAALEEERKKPLPSTARNLSTADVTEELAHWGKIKLSTRYESFQGYLDKYPNGLFAELAKQRVRNLANLQARRGDGYNVEETAGVEFGNYHALVIGIDDYKHLPKLETATNDAKSIARILEQNYGFKVSLLLNSDRGDIVDALYEYRETLTFDDNFLIYYAGHGWLDNEADRGYWLPRNAKKNRRSNWISNATITDTLRSLGAKHVMVVADSCYSGTLTRDANVGIRGKDYLLHIAAKPARVALVSGGLEPVADQGGGGNSPFANALISALAQNTSVIDGTSLFSQIRRPVVLSAQQTPEYSDVRNAGHEGGDFLFVRRN